jgi:hypothetical protein
VDGLNNRVADRTQKHAGESTTSVASDDDKLGGFRCVDKCSRSSITHQLLVHRDAGIAVLPTCQRLGQQLVFSGLDLRPVIAWNLGHINVIPRVQRYQVDVSTRRLLERDCRSEV